MRDVRLSKSARYALYAAGAMAEAGDRPVTVAEVAATCGVPPPALAKVFQQLVRAGIAAGTRGVGGGYRLARRARDVTLLEVLHVYDPPPSVEGAAGRIRISSVRRPPASERLHRLFDEVDEMVRCTFASVSLATLVGDRTRVPHPVEGVATEASAERPTRRRDDAGDAKPSAHPNRRPRSRRP